MKTTMLRMAEQMVNTPHRMATAREFLGRDKLVVVSLINLTHNVQTGQKKSW